MFAEIIKK